MGTPYSHACASLAVDSMLQDVLYCFEENKRKDSQLRKANETSMESSSTALQDKVHPMSFSKADSCWQQSASTPDGKHHAPYTMKWLPSRWAS